MLSWIVQRAKGESKPASARLLARRATCRGVRVRGEGSDMGGYLITGGRLLDATGAASQDGVSVLVEDNRIRKIGPDREVAAAAETLGGYRTIDAAGHTVMPGMIDAHCHIS